MGDQQDDGVGEEPEGKNAPAEEETPEAAAPPEPVAEPPPPVPAEQPETETPSEPTEQSMDIHKPKPIHSWRELATEFGVIVLGILTALGLEQAIETYHANEKTEEARQAIASELRISINNATVLQRMRDCSERQIAALSDIIGDGDLTEVRSQVDALRLPRPSAWSDSAWLAAGASNARDRFSEDERLNYSIQYEIVNQQRDLQARFLGPYGRLRSVSQSGLSRSGLAASAEFSDLAEMSARLRDMQRTAASLLVVAEGRPGFEVSQAALNGTPYPTQVADCEAAAAALAEDEG